MEMNGGKWVMRNYTWNIFRYNGETKDSRIASYGLLVRMDPERLIKRIFDRFDNKPENIKTLVSFNHLLKAMPSRSNRSSIEDPLHLLITSAAHNLHHILCYLPLRSFPSFYTQNFSPNIFLIKLLCHIMLSKRFVFLLPIIAIRLHCSCFFLSVRLHCDISTASNRFLLLFYSAQLSYPYISIIQTNFL